MRERCVRAGNEIVAQLSQPQTIARMRAAIPAERNVPGETPLPSFGIIDFALLQGLQIQPNGRSGRVWSRSKVFRR